jgi:hypothetical protein
VRYDKNLHPGPPRTVDVDDVATFLESWASVQELDKYQVSENSSMRKVSGNKGDLCEIALLLTNKN